MYLARRFVRNTIQYIIRESFIDGGVFRFRDLLELGSNPQQYILYDGSMTFVIDDLVSEGLKKQGLDADPFELATAYQELSRTKVDKR